MNFTDWTKLNARAAMLLPMNFERRTADQRVMDLPDHIRYLSDNEPAVHRLVRAYAYGHIASREELLLQIIVAQHTNWSEVRAKYMDQLAMQVNPIFFPKNP